MKSERSSAIESKMADEFSNLEFLNKNSPSPGSPKSDSAEVNNSQSFASAKPLKIEIEEGREEELSRYLSSRRRETIAVSHIPETSGRRRGSLFTGDNFGIPEISVCHSPSPPQLNDNDSQLQYKEKYLPRPAVLNVRPTFDRRASDGSATLQDSIAQFNLLRSLSKANPGGRYGQCKDGSRNMLSVPENETTGSESDNEQEIEASQYLANRGRQRRTLGTIFPSTPEEIEDSSLHKVLPKRPLKINANRASPVPYMPVTDARRMSDSIPTKKADDKETLVDVLEQHKKLKDQFAGGGARRSSASNSNHIFRHSYPFNEVEPVELPSANDPDLLKLRRKQEAQLQDLDVKFLVQKKILETKMAQERQELLRRASEGAPMLENSIAMFLRKHNADGKNRAGTAGATELQDEMKKLNLVNASSATDLPSFAAHDSPPQRLPTGGMDIDETAIDINSHYNFAGMHNLFQTQEARRRNTFLPLSSNFRVPRMRPNFPGIDPSSPHLWADRESVGGDSSPLIENLHETLSRTMSFDMTFSRSLDEISDLLKLSFLEHGVEYEHSGDTYYSLYKDGIQMEIEIYSLASAGDAPATSDNGVYNVKFRRVAGDVWPYKKLRDEIVAGIL